MPKKLPIVLLNISGLSMLIGNSILYFYSVIGDTFGDPVLINAQRLAAKQAGDLVFASFIYLVLCLIAIYFWFSEKHWILWAILFLTFVHITGFGFIFIKYNEFFLDLIAWIFLFMPIFWVIAVISDLIVLYQLFIAKKVFGKSQII
jgi:hypothetical protein